MKTVFKTLNLFLIMIVLNLIFQYTSIDLNEIRLSGDISVHNYYSEYTLNDWNAITSPGSFIIKTTTIDSNSTNYIENSSPSMLSYPILAEGYFALYATLLGDSHGISFNYDEKEMHLNLSDEYFSRNLSKAGITKTFVDVLKLTPYSTLDINFNENGTKLVSLSLVPISNSDFESCTSNFQKNKFFILDNDMYSDFFQGENSTYDDFLLNTVTQYDDMSISILNYCTSTTFSPFYKSKIAGVPYSNFSKYKNLVREGDINAFEDFTSLLKEHGSPIHIVNSEKENFSMFLSYRMNSFFPDDYRGFLNGSIYESFKGKRQKFNYKISFYYSDYRDYLFDLIQEGVHEFSPKGVTLDFTRTPNFFGYELLNRSTRKKILTAFVKRIHGSLPAETKLMVRFPHNYEKYDLDLPYWCENGYVDYISPSSMKYEEFFPIDKFISIIKNTDVLLLPSITANMAGEDLTKKTENNFENKGLNGINNEYLKVRDYLLRAKYLYDKGASGVLLFNTNTHIGDSYKLPKKLSYLNSTEALNKWYLFEYQMLFRHESKP